MSQANPLERVNYYPGQRLLAADLNQQETYDLTVRRLLNRGLFSAGVVSGLDVTRVQGSSKDLLVAAGLALDPQGREVYLASDTTVTVPNQPSSPGTPGYYLVIRYAETTEPGALSGCSSPSTVPPTGRVLVAPILEFTETYPNPRLCGVSTGGASPEANCGVVLALVTLDSSCNVAGLEAGVRQYAFPTHTSQVTAMALEGERDINPDNAKELKFHVRGGAPTAVILHIRGRRFSTLHYTEVGRHHHPFSLNSVLTDPETAPIQIGHTHHVLDNLSDTIDTNLASASHHHSIHMSDLHPVPGRLSGILTGGAVQSSSSETNDFGTDWIDDTNVDHQHNVPSHDTQDSSRQTTPPHQHTLSTSAGTADAGVVTPPDNLYAGHGGDALTYLNDLQVSLDGQDITGALLSLLPGWGTLGNGLASHQINAADGTGGIDLIQLTSRTLDVGPHTLLFSVGSGGGKLVYNLYIE